MQLNKVQNEFLGCTTAIAIENQEQFLKFREWMAIQNLFLQDGTPVTQLNVDTSKRVAFYRDDLGMFVGYDHPANILMNYSIKEFKEAFPDAEDYEQRSLFGNDDSPGIKPPEEDLIIDPMEDAIEVENREVQDELSLAETLNKLEIGSITPATITGNVIEFKNTVINAINQYKNIVVTQENFQELTDTRADLNNKKNVITENRKNIKKKALEEVDKVYDAMTDIIKAIDDVVGPLDSEIKGFEAKEKEALKNKIMENTINPMLNMLVDKKMIDEDIKALFVFNKSWTNASAFTKTGNLTKKTENEINGELERLVKLYQQKVNDIETIKSTVVQLASAHELDAQLNADTYIELYKKGASMPGVQERINSDIRTIKDAIQKEAQKAQNMVSQQQTSKQEQEIKCSENIPATPINQSNTTILSDEKTGEVLAKGNDHQILASVVSTPDKYNNRTFEYTYSFSGSFGTIKTFSNILKLLSMMFKDFKYERK